MKERNITTIDDKLYSHIAGRQDAILSFDEPRNDIFWQALNEQILKNLSDFVTLRLFGKFEQDLSFLKFLGYVKTIKFKTYKKPDIETFPEMPQINRLGFGWLDWSEYSLNFLQKFQNVKYLGIEGHFVDAENFQLLPRLTSLFLTYNEKVLDYGFLTEMIQLKELYVMNHEFVTDLSPIGHLTNLPILELYNLPQLKNVDFLADMQGLEVLELTLPSLQQFPVLSACPPIKRLVLEEITRSCDISAVAHLTSLEEFYIKESDVNAQNLIPVLEQLPHLKRARFGLEDEDWDKVNAYLVSRGIDPHANAKSHYG